MKRYVVLAALCAATFALAFAMGPWLYACGAVGTFIGLFIGDFVNRKKPDFLFGFEVCLSLIVAAMWPPVMLVNIAIWVVRGAKRIGRAGRCA